VAKVPQISHTRAIRAFKKAGFQVIRAGKHISMYDGKNIIIIPRANPINTFTLKGIINDAGLTVDQFKKLL
jgi:predicted RNA binding protein YcfA (HicA-like mRNA interferase family)